MFNNKSPVILVIEDNRGDFILIDDYLREKFPSPEIINATNFSDATKILTDSSKRFDVVLLDLELPDKTGYPLIAEITGLARECVLIILTGYTDIEFSIKSLSMGVSDYLAKDDLNPTSLYKSIIYNVERKKTNQRLAESEKRFSGLFQLSPQPMWVFDPETFNFVIVNDAAVEKYGYTEQELLSMTIMDIRPPEEHERVRNIVSSRPTETVNMVGGHFKHKKKSGEIIDVEVYSSPLVLNGKLFRTVIAIDVTEKQLFEQQMTKAIVRTQEEERYEIGSELHDNVCQLLATSQMLLGMLKGSLEPGAMKIYDQTKQYITLALEDIRNLSHRLAPAFYEDATMEDTFKMLIGSTKMASSFDIKLQFGKSLRRHAFTMDVQLNLYRVLQEQLRNITKYAKATSVKINVDIDDTDLRMQIADDGVGFDVGAVNEGIGLANMRRRAELFQGNFEITSSPGNGCRVTITIPLKASLSQTPVQKT